MKYPSSQLLKFPSREGYVPGFYRNHSYSHVEYYGVCVFHGNHDEMVTVLSKHRLLSTALKSFDKIAKTVRDISLCRSIDNGGLWRELDLEKAKETLKAVPE